MAKANKDGWIRHRGGKCPVEKGTRVDVRYRNGDVSMNQPALEDGSPLEKWASCWEHYGDAGDIMSYRLHATKQQQEPKPMTAEEIRAQYMENLSSIAMLHTKNAALVDELRKLGFDFYENPAVAQQEDMSDPKNWRVGDYIECIESRIAPLGSIKKIARIEDDTIFRQGGGSCEIDSICQFWKFHSRPSK